MYSEFAYSGTMQLILAGIAFLTSFIFIYMIAELILAVYGEIASAPQKIAFAFVIGVILNQAWIYGIYIIGGRNSFSTMTYVLVVTPNPVFALLYYLCGIKLLKLSPFRSIKLMEHVYLYFIVTGSIGRLMRSIFFVQTGERYSYLLDATNQLVFTAVFFAIYFVTRWYISHSGNTVKIGEKLFVNIKRDIALYFLKALVIYLLMVCIPYFFGETVAANFALLVILALTFAAALLLDYYRAARNDTKNKEAHIAVLQQELIELRRSEALDFASRINRNLSLVSILIGRRKYACRLCVDMNISLHGRFDDLFIDNTDACSIVDGLLGDAIETAARSGEKRVYFSIESKGEDVKLIIVSGSAPDYGEAGQPAAPPPGWCGSGIASVRKIIAGYGNCALHLNYYKCEMSAYLEIRGT